MTLAPSVFHSTILRLFMPTRFIVAALFLFSVCSQAQEPVSKRVVGLIDSALSIMDMSKRDCSLRSDIVTADVHRSSAVSALFASPLKSFDYAAFYAKALREVGPDQGDGLFTRAMSDCLLGVYQPLDYASNSALDIPISISASNGEPLPTSYLDNFTMSYLIRQFVFPVLRAAKAMQQAHAGLLKNDFLRAHADSLYIMSSEDATASPYELKRAELRGDSIARQFFDDAAMVDQERITSGSLSLYKHLVLSGALSQTGINLLRDSVKSCVIDSPFGRIYIGSAGRDEYRGDYLLILDVGGDDRYVCTQTKDGVAARPLRVVIDLSGNDEYLGSSYTLGAGIFGGGLLIDMAGNDLYKAGSFSLGAGLFGVGAVYDGGGNDIYVGGTFSQGAGAFGIGLLTDCEGNDSYTVQAYGQAFGGTRGGGYLVDKSGNDVYSTVSPFVDVLRYDEHYISFTQGASLGNRPIAGGGFGVLVDSKGNDTYTCDIYGQGSSYWFGYAALIDEAGEDRYQAYQYAQGAGIHFAHGLLLDRKGDDVYVSHGVSQGCGHDVGVGIIVDENGDDSYVAESLSLGGGNANAVSILVDVNGNDAYMARNPTTCFGYSDFRRSYGMIGVFADGAGNDMYGDLRRNATTSVKSTFGVFLDVANAPSAAAPAASVIPVDSAQKKYPIATSIDSLFVQACTAPQKFQYMVQPARDSIVQRLDALLYLARYIGTTQPRERLALENMMTALYKRDTVRVTKLVTDSLESSVLSTVQFCLWLAGKCSIKAASVAMIRCLQHPDWRVRAAAAQNIGDGKFDDIVSKCFPLLKDTVSHVRMRAAYTIASRSPSSVFDVLKPALNDPSQLVRNAVGMGLRSTSSLPFTLLRDAFDIYALPRAQRALIRALPALDTAAPRDSVAMMIGELEQDEREAAYRAVRDEKSLLWQEVLELCRTREKNVDLLTELGSTTPVPTTLSTSSQMQVNSRGKKALDIKAKKAKKEKKNAKDVRDAKDTKDAKDVKDAKESKDNSASENNDTSKGLPVSKIKTLPSYRSAPTPSGESATKKTIGAPSSKPVATIPAKPKAPATSVDSTKAKSKAPKATSPAPISKP